MSQFNTLLDRLDLSDLKPAAVLTDYRALSSRLAEVIVSGDFRGQPTRSARLDLVASALPYGTAPMEGTFRWLNDTSLIGMAHKTEAREFKAGNPAEIQAAMKQSGWRVTASNVYMSPEDSSLWQVQATDNGCYLTRASEDDLADLLENNRSTSFAASSVRFSSVVSASALSGSAVSFVYDGGHTPMVAIGFTSGVSKDGKTMRVVSDVVAGKVLDVPASYLISSHVIDPTEMKQAIVSAQRAKGISRAELLVAANEDAPEVTFEKYMLDVFGLNPEFVALTKKAIADVASAAA